ncbi:MAG: kelch repeat-containing protein [Acidobacteriota bacterium]
MTKAMKSLKAFFAAFCVLILAAVPSQMNLQKGFAASAIVFASDVPIASSFRMPIAGDTGSNLQLLTIDSFNNFNYPKIRFNEDGDNQADPNKTEWFVATAFNQNRWLNKGWNSEPSLTRASEYDDNNKPKDGSDYHPGEDWNLNTGGDTDRMQPIYAIADGIVLFSGCGYGNTIIIAHKLPTGELITSFYGHMEDPSPFQIGQIVYKGYEIGHIGKTILDCRFSQKFSAHLHFEIRKQSMIRINPDTSEITLAYPAGMWPATDANAKGTDNGFSFIAQNYYSPSELLHQQGIPMWMQKHPSTNPSAREQFGMAYDAARQQVVLFGGVANGPSGLTLVNDTWVWDGTTWTQKFPTTSPQARSRHRLAYDAARQKVVLFGGTGNGVIFSDTWVWDGTTWTQETPPTSPPTRSDYAMAYDAARQQVLLFGGYTGDSGNPGSNETWVWDGTTWTQKFPSSSPEPRLASSMAYDVVRQQILLFGGVDPNVGSGLVLGDTWVWDGTTWIQKFPSTTPQARYSPAMAYDGARGQVILFGGGLSDSSLVSDTWVWDGSNWTQRLPATSPPARIYSGIAYDAARMQVLLFGGSSNAFTHILLNDTWVSSSQ